MKNLNDINLLESTVHTDNITPVNGFKTTMKKDSSFTLHWHKEFEMTYVYSGSCTYKINLNSYEVLKGDIILISNEMLHSGITKNEDFEGLTIVFDTSMLRSILTDATDIKFVIPIISSLVEITPLIKNSCEDDEYIKNLFLNFINIFVNRPYAFEIQLKTIIYQLMSFFCTKKYIVSISKNNLEKNKKIETIKTIINYINSNIQQEIYLTDIAKEINFDECYITRFFKKYVGMTCFDYINFSRVNLAAELLLSSNLSVTEIGLEVGYKNTSYFLKRFKEKYGTTPNSYRKSFAVEALK